MSVERQFDCDVYLKIVKKVVWMFYIIVNIKY